MPSYARFICLGFLCLFLAAGCDSAKWFHWQNPHDGDGDQSFDPCAEVSCGPGQFCFDGLCEDDGSDSDSDGIPGDSDGDGPGDGPSDGIGDSGNGDNGDGELGDGESGDGANDGDGDQPCSDQRSDLNFCAEEGLVCGPYTHLDACEDLRDVDCPCIAEPADTLSAGRGVVCAILATGELACGGRRGGMSRPPAGTFEQLSVFEETACALREDGEILCWGGNIYGEQVVPNGPFLAVDAGTHHVCAIREDLTPLCWGFFDEDHEAAIPSIPVNAITAGYNHTCVLTTDNEAQCVGDNFDGEATPPGGAFMEISAGISFTCGLRVDGALECWGNLNTDGFATNLETIDSGDFHACGVTDNGEADCVGSFFNFDTPSLVNFEYVEIAAGIEATCGIRIPDNLVYCWGFSIEDFRRGPPRLSGCLIEATVLDPNSPFSDYTTGMAGYQEARLLWFAQVVDSCSTSENPAFCPGCDLDRQTAAAWLTTGLDTPSLANPPFPGVFSDLAPNLLAYPYAAAAIEASILSECAAGEFCAETTLSRGEFADVLARAMNWDSPGGATEFTDVASGHQYFDGIRALESRCVLVECEDNQFCPDETIDRGAAAQFFARALNLGEINDCL